MLGTRSVGRMPPTAIVDRTDATFRALADPTRRSVVAQLTRGPATVSELAAPFEMSLPSFLQHLRVLEDSGVIRSSKRGRVRTCRLESTRLRDAEDWLATQRDEWERRVDRLADFAERAEQDAP